MKTNLIKYNEIVQDPNNNGSITTSVIVGNTIPLGL